MEIIVSACTTWVWEEEKGHACIGRRLSSRSIIAGLLSKHAYSIACMHLCSMTWCYSGCLWQGDTLQVLCVGTEQFTGLNLHHTSRRMHRHVLVMITTEGFCFTACVIWPLL
jgi:hypothetical protein